MLLVPLLLGLDILTEHGLNVMLATDELQSATEGWTMPLHRQYGHIALTLEMPSSTWYTRNQPLRLQKHLVHPSTHKLLNLLRRVDPSGTPPGTKEVLKEIALACHACQTFASRPIPFQIRDLERIIINHEVRIDLLWIEGKAIVHVVDAGTTFSPATYVSNQDVASIWNAFLRCWSTMYV
jgi:hypothetical protein